MLFQVPHRQGFWRDEDVQGVLGFSLEGSMRMSMKERKAFSVAGKKQIWWDRSRELTRDNPRWDLVADIVILRASEIYWLCHNFRETLSDYVSEKIKNKKKETTNGHCLLERVKHADKGTGWLRRGRTTGDGDVDTWAQVAKTFR